MQFARYQGYPGTHGIEMYEGLTVSLLRLPTGLQSEKYESVQQTLASIHQQLNKFIESEKCAMDERLR